MKKKYWFLILLIGLLLPFFEGLFSTVGSWRSAASGSGETKLIESDLLDVTYSQTIVNEDEIRWKLFYTKKEVAEEPQFQLKFSGSLGEENAIFEEHPSFEMANQWFVEGLTEDDKKPLSEKTGAVSFVTAKDVKPLVAIVAFTFHPETAEETVLLEEALELQLNQPEAADDGKKDTNQKEAADGEEELGEPQPKTKLDLTIPEGKKGKLLQESQLMIKNAEDQWQNYLSFEEPRPEISEITDLRLEYTFDLEQFYLTEAGKIVKRQIEEARDEHELSLHFTFEIDEDFNLASSLKDVPIEGASEEEYGSFHLIKNGGTNDRHLFEVTLNHTALTENKVKGHLWVETLFSVTEEETEREILLGSAEEVSVTVPISTKRNGYSIKKTALGTPKKVTHNQQDFYFVEWQIEVTPGKDQAGNYLPLKKLRLVDTDISKKFGNSTQMHGFEFPAQDLSALIEKNDLTFFEVKFAESDKLLTEGKKNDYYLDFHKTGASGFTIEFDNVNYGVNTAITEPMTITYTTLLKNQHPMTLGNKVVSTASDVESLTVAAQLDTKRHSLTKTVEDIGNNRLRWTIVYYHAPEAGKPSFSYRDVMQGGSIDFSTLTFKDDQWANGRTVYPAKDADKFYKPLYQSNPPLVALTPAKNNAGFEMKFNDQLPQGRYLITYESSYQEISKVANTIEGEGLQASSQGKNDITVTKGPLNLRNNKQNYNHYRDNEHFTIYWKSTIQTVAGQGKITINDAAAGKYNGKEYAYGLHYYFNKEAPKEEIIKNGAPNLAYLRERGIVIAYENEQGQLVEIPDEDILSLTTDNGTTKDEDSGHHLLDDKKGIASQVDPASWEGKKAGFTVEVSQLHAGKKLTVYVATKYGGVGDIVPRQSTEGLEHYLFNTIEAVQNETFSDKAEGKVVWSDDTQSRTSILKTGQADFIKKEADWQILANAWAFDLKAGDQIGDQINRWNYGGAGANNHMTFVKPKTSGNQKEYSDVRITIMKYRYSGDPSAANAKETFHDLEEVRELDPEEYKLTFPTDTSFMIDLKKDLGNVQLKIEVKTYLQYDNALKESKASEIKLYNHVMQKIGNQTIRGGASIAAAWKDGLLEKTVADFDSNHQLPWEVKINQGYVTLDNLEIIDNPDNLMIDMTTFEFYKEVKEKNEKGKTDTRWEMVEKEDYQLESSPNGYGYHIKFNKDVVIDVPLLLRYKGDVLDFQQEQVANQIKISYGETQTVKELKPVVKAITKAGGGANGTNYGIQLRKVSSEDQTQGLQGARFILEKRVNDTWKVVDEQSRTDQNGYLRYTRLSGADYRITEAEAPIHYKGYQKPVYFTIDSQSDDPIRLTDNQGNHQTEIDRYYSMNGTGQTQMLTMQVANDPVEEIVEPLKIEFEAKKVLQQKELTKDQTFNFELWDITDKDEVIAYGSVTISELAEPAPITFYTDKAQQYPITDWNPLLNLDRRFRIVETGAEDYDISWQGSNTDQENEFLVTAEDLSFHFVITNKQPTLLGFLPSTGGSGIMKYALIAAVILAIVGGFGGYYIYRNRKVK